MFSNLTRNRWDLERQDIQCSSKHDFLGVLCVEIESDREKARQSVTNTEIVHNQSHTLLSDSDIWLVLWFSRGVQFKIKLTYLTLLPQRVVATMNYCAALLWYISGPDPAIGARLLSFNRTQTRVVIGLFTGHNTLRRYLHIMGLCNDPICRKCGTEEETSVHILCECEALASLRHAYLGSFFLYPEDIRELGMGAIWNFAKGTGLL